MKGLQNTLHTASGVESEMPNCEGPGKLPARVPALQNASKAHRISCPSGIAPKSPNFVHVGSFALATAEI